MGNVRKVKDSKLLKQTKTYNGYKIVSLKNRHFRVHRLVAENFLDNKDDLPYVNHKDENKKNNNLSNLEWCSASYNINYGDRNNKVAKKVSIWRKEKGSDYSPRERKKSSTIYT